MESDHVPEAVAEFGGRGRQHPDGARLLGVAPAGRRVAGTARQRVVSREPALDLHSVNSAMRVQRVGTGAFPATVAGWPAWLTPADVPAGLAHPATAATASAVSITET